ncbi:MAG: hemolysin family protein [Methanomassiliicoccaceae archaeon]|nr:hemolysin family protein [Methanomassiliicoccaceae archaeon]
MDEIIIVLIAALTFMIGSSAFFSLSETSFTSMNRIRMKNYAKEGNKKAEKAIDISEDYDRLLTTILVGNTFVNISAATISAILFAIFIIDANVSAAVSTVVLTLILLTFGEVTPKCIAKERPEKIAMKVAGTLSVLIVIFYPLSMIFVGLRKLLTRSIPEEDAPTITEEELIVMIDEIREEGTIEKRESDLIKSAIEFDDITVSEMCTPRVDITALEVKSDIEKIKRAFMETGFSRIPVYRETVDQIIGVVYIKDFYNLLFDSDGAKMEDVIRPIKFVPTTMKISVLLKDFQKSKTHMAVVIDEYGGTVGIVTLEDAVEELIGEIWDESDEIEHKITENADGSYLVHGDAHMSDLTEFGIDMDLEDFEGDTIGGLILYKLGRIPTSGDVIDMDTAVMTVKSVKNRRIREVLITKAEKEETPEDKDSD